MKSSQKALITLAAGGFITVCTGILAYGALVEANRLKEEIVNLELENWPDKLDGFRIAFIADLHIRDQYSLKLAETAIEKAMACNPDTILFGGDFLADANPKCLNLLRKALQPLKSFGGKKVTCLGNHDYVAVRRIRKEGPLSTEYWAAEGDSPLLQILKDCGIECLVNDIVELNSLVIAGIGSATLGLDDAKTTMEKALSKRKPIITLWHEPDMVDHLPEGSSLMLSGHSHGGQFTFWWGWTPMYTDLGRKYPRGFYPMAKTPLYVSRGIGTTGPPSRLNCSPELSIITLSRAGSLAAKEARKVNY